MKKTLCQFKFVVTIVLICTAAAAFAQVPNGGFENWTSGNPDYWVTANSSYIFVTQYSPAHSGSYAAKSAAVTIAPNVNLTSPLGTGTPNVTNLVSCHCHPEAVHFWYILNAPNNESLSCGALLGQNGGGYASTDQLDITGSNSVYKEGVMNFVYGPGSGNADTLGISFVPVGYPSNSDFTVGYYFIIDDVTFGPAETASSINETPGNMVLLEQSVPNPAGSSAEITYSIATAQKVSLDIFDITGRKVETVINAQMQTAGRYRAIAETGSLGQGIYYYVLTVNGQSYTGKMEVVH